MLCFQQQVYLGATLSHNHKLRACFKSWTQEEDGNCFCWDKVGLMSGWEEEREAGNQRREEWGDDRTEPGASSVLTRLLLETIGAELTERCPNRHTSRLMRNQLTQLWHRKSGMCSDSMKWQGRIHTPHPAPDLNWFLRDSRFNLYSHNRKVDGDLSWQADCP